MKFRYCCTSLTLLIGLVMGLTTPGCGDGTTAVNIGDQFTLDVEGTIVVADASDGSTSRSIQLDGEPQVLIGAMIVEIRENFFDGLGVDIINLDVSAQVPDIGEIQLTINPQIISSGIIQKIDEFGQPFGQSILNVDTNLTIPDGQTISLGNLTFMADQNEPNKLPVLGEIPLISFLFNERAREAEISNLLITLTPQIIVSAEE